MRVVEIVRRRASQLLSSQLSILPHVPAACKRTDKKRVKLARMSSNVGPLVGVVLDLRATHLAYPCADISIVTGALLAVTLVARLPQGSRTRTGAFPLSFTRMISVS